ncbi:MAG: cytochrome c biogenesis protein ResB [Gemmataceae bacterium]|nr:cytochrome c biogenesis protein ResB [Gemmataceae bacterium]
MSSTAIQAGLPPPRPAGAPDEAKPARQSAPRSRWYRVLEFCASLRLTVVLFVLAFVLVFYGTWAQKEQGIWTVVNEYFRCDVAWIPVRVLCFFLLDIPPSYRIPFPGGWLIGSLLMCNLLAAHAVRFQFSWRRSGILLTHAGLVLLMLGEFITGVFAIEGRMTIMEGYSSNFVESDRKVELAIVRRLSPDTDEETLVPGVKLAKGRKLSDPLLPFDIEIIDFMPHSELLPVRAGAANPATTGIGLKQMAVPRDETAGVDPNQKIEIASAYVRLRAKGKDDVLGTYLVSTYHTLLHYQPDQVEVDGQKYEISLRAQRNYRDYTIFLREFHHKVYPGTKIPKDYRSVVRLTNKATNDDLAVDIYMNHPLRYRGETFYQSSLHPLTKGTVLQVVRNPAWTLPYIACTIVTLGMLVHFGIVLLRFLMVRLPALTETAPAAVASGGARRPPARS